MQPTSLSVSAAAGAALPLASTAPDLLSRLIRGRWVAPDGDRCLWSSGESARIMSRPSMKAVIVCVLGLLLASDAVLAATSGRIVAWGRNDYGQCDVPEPDGNFESCAGGDGHTIGLTSYGSIVTWGIYYYGLSQVPVEDEPFVGLAAGTYHSLGLRTNGMVSAWDLNTGGQCDVPEPNRDFVAVAGGRSFSLGLTSDGRIVAWGANGSGQCDVPEPNESYLAVCAGQDHALAIRQADTLVEHASWGRIKALFRVPPN